MISPSIKLLSLKIIFSGDGFMSFRIQSSIIPNYEVVEKREVILPDELCGIVKCANPKCITNNEPMPTRFHVIDKEHCVIRCHYCEKEQYREQIEVVK